MSTSITIISLLMGFCLAAGEYVGFALFSVCAAILVFWPTDD
jgi:hypothetical protein